MLPIQKHAGRWNDGTIIGCSPVVTGACMEPSRIVLRDLGDTYVVHCQYWPVSEVRDRVVMPSYMSGNYYIKSEIGALARAWDCMYDRYNNLVGREERLMGRIGALPSDKAALRTEITTMGERPQPWNPIDEVNKVIRKHRKDKP